MNRQSQSRPGPRKPHRKSIIGQIFRLIKKIFKLAFLPIRIFFRVLRYVLKWISRYLWHPFKRRWDAMREKARIKKELAKMAHKHKFDYVEHLVEVLGGIDNIVSVNAGVRAIYITVELEFLIELDELESFGFVWHELEKGSLTLTLGFQSPFMAKIINKYVQVTRKPRVRRHSTVSAPKLDFSGMIKKTKDFVLNLKDQLLQLQEKAIALYEKKKAEFEIWYAKKKEEWRERKIKRAQERKRRKLERARARRAKKLMAAAKKKQKAAMAKQRKMKQAAMRKQKAYMKQAQAKAKQNARKAKLQSQKRKAKTGKRPATKGRKRR